jgi:hypothetical protein
MVIRGSDRQASELGLKLGIFEDSFNDLSVQVLAVGNRQSNLGSKATQIAS